MERKKVIICSVVGFLGLLSALMGFGAEATRTKASQIRFSDTNACIYPKGAATVGLALGATAAIVIAQIIVTAVTGCFCCRRGSYDSSNTGWRIGLICFGISWITFVNAIRLFLSGAVITGRRHTHETDGTDTVFCAFEVVKAGAFAVGAILALVTAVLAIVGYHTWDVAKTSDDPTAAFANQGGIAMGRPQFPSTQYPGQPRAHYAPAAPPQYPPSNTQPPAFVHEDTYIRRQYP